MDGKDGRDKGAPPKGPGHLPQHQKNQDHRRGVKEDIGQMMPGGMQSVQLAVEHVGNPSQRMPVIGMKMGERPDDSPEAQPVGNHRILINILVVIHLDEIEPQGLPENRKGNRGERQADRRRSPA